MKIGPASGALLAPPTSGSSVPKPHPRAAEKAQAIFHVPPSGPAANTPFSGDRMDAPLKAGPDPIREQRPYGDDVRRLAPRETAISPYGDDVLRLPEQPVYRDDIQPRELPLPQNGTAARAETPHPEPTPPAIPETVLLWLRQIPQQAAKHELSILNLIRDARSPGH